MRIHCPNKNTKCIRAIPRHGACFWHTKVIPLDSSTVSLHSNNDSQLALGVYKDPAMKVACERNREKKFPLVAEHCNLQCSCSFLQSISSLATTQELTTNQSLAMSLIPGLILGLRPANESRCYFVTTSLIGWVQAWNQPCIPLAVLGHG